MRRIDWRRTNQLPLSPHWQLFAAARYRLPLPFPGDTRVGADATYNGAYFSYVFNYNQGRVPPQAYVDAFVSYAPPGGHWTFSLTGKNLGDKLAYQSITWGGTPNLWEGPVSPPRTVVAKIGYAY